MQIEDRLSQNHTFYIHRGMDHHASCMVLGQQMQCKLITVSAEIRLSAYLLGWIIMLPA